MNTLFKDFQEKRNTGTRSGYSIPEQLALVILAAEGKSVKEISTIVGRSTNSLQYKLSKRGIGDVKTPQDFAKKVGEEYKESVFKTWHDAAKKIIAG